MTLAPEKDRRTANLGRVWSISGRSWSNSSQISGQHRPNGCRVRAEFGVEENRAKCCRGWANLVEFGNLLVEVCPCRAKFGRLRSIVGRCRACFDGFGPSSRQHRPKSGGHTGGCWPSLPRLGTHRARIRQSSTASAPSRPAGFGPSWEPHRHAFREVARRSFRNANLSNAASSLARAAESRNTHGACTSSRNMSGSRTLTPKKESLAPRRSQRCRRILPMSTPPPSSSSAATSRGPAPEMADTRRSGTTAQLQRKGRRHLGTCHGPAPHI